MEHTIDTIVRDIIALDPELSGREVEIRSIIAALSDAKPSVEIDGAFLNRLRARLAKPMPAQPIASPWFVVFAARLAPVTALALLLLILAPSFVRSPDSLQNGVLPEMYTTSMESGDAPVAMPAPSANAPPMHPPQTPSHSRRLRKKLSPG